MENESKPQAVLSPEQLERLVQGGMTYAVLDPVGLPAIETKMQNAGPERAISLYRGSSFEAYTAVSPYLVQVDETLLAWIHKEVGEEIWGIFIFSRMGAAELFEHLHKFVTTALPDGTMGFFRFYDPRILPVFLASPDAVQSGFWSGITAVGWPVDGGVHLERRPDAVPETPHGALANSLMASPELVGRMARNQVESFLERCAAYFKLTGAELPAERDNFFAAGLRYASALGVSAEIDVVRLLQMLLEWKDLRTLPFAREILAMESISGKDKVDLLCEIAAFATEQEAGPEPRGVDKEAKANALKKLAAANAEDPVFLDGRPGGALTMAKRDLRWRKEWLMLYEAEVSGRAKVTDVELGATTA